MTSGGDEERAGQAAADRPRRRRQLATEEQRQASADVEQRRLRAGLGQGAGGGAGAEARGGRRDVRERHAVEDSGEHELPGGHQTEHDQRRGPAGDHDRGERDWDQQRQYRLVLALARDDLGEQVIDDLHRRVDDVEGVAEHPDSGLRERDAPARRRLDERVQAAGAADVTRVAQPDRERRDEHDGRREHRQPGRLGRIGGEPRRGQRRERQRSAERGDGDAGEGPRPDRPVGRRPGPAGRVAHVMKRGGARVAAGTDPDLCHSAAPGLGR